MANVYQCIAAWRPTLRQAAADSIPPAPGECPCTIPAPSGDLTGIKQLISGPGYKSATRNLLDALADQPAVEADTLGKLVEAAEEDRQKCLRKVGGKGHRRGRITSSEPSRMLAGSRYRHGRRTRKTHPVRRDA